MKRFIILFTLMAFLITGAVATYSLAQSGAKEQLYNCCVKGNCKKVTKEVCAKAGGKIVKDCKDCKPIK